MTHTVVLGLGNLLLGDEGVGVHAARALAEAGLPGAEVLDVGTAILDALPALGRAERLVVIDAVQAGGSPGSIYRMPFDQVRPAATVAGLHGFDLSRALALAGRADAPERVVILGVEPGHIGWSLELSPAVAEAVPFLLDAVRAEVEGRALG